MPETFVVAFVIGVTPNKWARVWNERMPHLPLELRPSSMHDAQTKLLYLVHFLATTKRSFDHDEMSAIIGSVAHLL